MSCCLFNAHQCITDAFRAKGINSSRDLPDDVLNFARRHPLVSRHIRPMDNRPLLVKRRVSYTQIAVLRVAALDGQQYDLLFIGTGGSVVTSDLQV